MADGIPEAIRRASKLVTENRKPYTVYIRNGKVGVIPLQTYLDANLDEKGARRVTTVTMNGKGKLI